MKGQTSQPILSRKLQRGLRNRPTDAEARLWRHLRLCQLDGCKFRRQHPHHHAVLDFVCLERKLVIEVDGGQHADSRADHTAMHCSPRTVSSSCGSGTMMCSATRPQSWN